MNRQFDGVSGPKLVRGPLCGVNLAPPNPDPGNQDLKPLVFDFNSVSIQSQFELFLI